MKILVLYSQLEKTSRKTVQDHLYSFKNYVPDISFHYCNVLTNFPFYLSFVKYDGIIIHYTFFALRWNTIIWKKVRSISKQLKKFSAVKVAMPQDEYAFTNDISTFLKDAGIKTIFTCAYKDEYQTLYPKEKTGLEHYFTTYTGYIDEKTVKKIDSFQEKKRDIDIGYRARKLPFWLGRHGQLKKDLGDAFLNIKNKTSLKLDISLDPKDVFLGDDWLKFLLRCRAVLGCLGGASLLDKDGVAWERTELYTKQHPNASFEDVEKACFKGMDQTLQLFALSPRHFECAVTRTCQVLVEGNYDGVFKPGIHYIELKKDFSNIYDVLKDVADLKKCEKMTEKAYEDIVLSGQYTYAKFANQVIAHIKSQSKGSFTKAKAGFILAAFMLKIRDFFRIFYAFHYQCVVIVGRAYRYVMRRLYRHILKKMWCERW